MEYLCTVDLVELATVLSEKANAISYKILLLY